MVLKSNTRKGDCCRMLFKFDTGLRFSLAHSFYKYVKSRKEMQNSCAPCAIPFPTLHGMQHARGQREAVGKNFACNNAKKQK